MSVDWKEAARQLRLVAGDDECDPTNPFVDAAAKLCEREALVDHLLKAAEKMADGCTVGNFGMLQNQLRARAKRVREATP